MIIICYYHLFNKSYTILIKSLFVTGFLRMVNTEENSFVISGQQQACFSPLKCGFQAQDLLTGSIQIHN